MAKRSLGFVELSWECPNCQAKNKGLDKTCKQCGAPQPENLQFGLDEDAKKISDEKILQELKNGADFHCPYCGTRNIQGTVVCTQCGGDLTDATKRTSGNVLTAKANTICPKCGNKNQFAATTCAACGSIMPKSGVHNNQPTPESTPHEKKSSPIRPWMALPVIAGLLLLCSLIWLLFFKTNSVMGTVESTHWSRSIQIESFIEVKKQAWKDLIPSDGKVLECKMEFRENSDQPTDNSKEICATKVVDQGNGAGEVVEECHYEVYDNYCTFTVFDWDVTNELTKSGDGLTAIWPPFTPTSSERIGVKTENYDVNFSTSNGIKTYSTSDYNYFQNFSIGSEWMLSINTLGGIVDISQ